MANRSLGTLTLNVVAEVGQFEKGMDRAQRAAEKNARQLEREQKAIEAANKGFLDGLKEQADAIGKTRVQLLEMQAAQKGLADQAAPYIQKLKEQEQALQKGGVTAKQTAAALRGVPAQFTDIFVSLQGGQAPLTVFLQQGGQLKDMFGGIGPAARALGGYIAGLVNPFTISAAAIAGFVAVAVSADRRLRDLMDTSIRFAATGRVVDIQGVDSLISKINDLPGVSRNAAVQVVDAFAAVRNIGPSMLEPLSLIVADFAKATGTDIPAAAKRLADAFKDPVAGAKQLDEQLGILSAEQTLSIQKMVEQNNIAGAQATLLEALTTRVKGLADQGMTPLARSTDDLSNSWDRLKRGLGDPQGFNEANVFLSQIINKIAWIVEHSRGIKIDFRDLSNVEANLPSIASLRQSRVTNVSVSGQVTPSAGGGRGFVNPDILKPRDLDENLKNLLETTKQFKSQAGEAEKVKKQIDEIRGSLQYMRQEGKQDSLAYKELSDRLVGAQERLDSMTKKSGGASAKAYQDDAATRMLQQLREQEAVLREQLAGTDKLGAAQRELIKFEQQITDLKEKRQLTADQKSLLAAQESIKAQLQKNAAIEASVKLREEELREEKRIADLNKQFNERARQREETIRNNSDSRNEQYQKSLGAFGLSERQRQEVEAQRTVYREFQRMQLDLVKNTPKEILGSDKYVAEMLKIKEAQDQALQDLQSYFDSIRQLQGDWTNGATRALSTYVDDVANVSAQVERLFTNTFSGLEDSLVNFVKTGKLSFSDLADSIIADIARIIIRQQITGPLAQLVQGNLGGGGFINDLLGGLFGGARANGGPTQAGKFYEVNERGSELFTQGGRTYLMSSGDGRVDPIRGGMGGGFTQQNQFVVQGRIDRSTQNQIADKMRRQTNTAVARLS